MNLESSVWVVKTQFSEIREISGKNKSKTILKPKSPIKMLKNSFKPIFELISLKVWLFEKRNESHIGDGGDGLLP